MRKSAHIVDVSAQADLHSGKRESANIEHERRREFKTKPDCPQSHANAPATRTMEMLSRWRLWVG